MARLSDLQPWRYEHLVRRAQETVQCYQCLKSVDTVRLFFNPSRFGFVLEFHCHGECDKREVRVCGYDVDEVEVVDEALSRCAITFLPEQGADMEHAFNRMGAPRVTT